MTSADVRLDGVGKVYSSRHGDVTAVESADLSIEAGQFVCIVGASGCGKSTLLRMIAGIQPVSSGTITVAGEPVTGPTPNCGVVFQQPNLFPWLTVEDNIGFGPRMRGTPSAQRATRVDELLDTVGLRDSRRLLPHELSGGMQQRAAIARALADDPALLLMDEPFGALDALTRDQMQEELLAIWRRTRRTIVFVTHSVEEAVYLGTHVVLMSAKPGRVREVIDVRLPELAGASSRQVRTHPDFVAMRGRVDEHFFGAGA